MPRATVWIRNEDWEKWRLIQNKPELISQAINRSEISVVKKKDGSLGTVQEIPQDVMLSPKQQLEQVEREQLRRRMR